MATAPRTERRKGLFATKDTDALVRDTEEKGASLNRVVGFKPAGGVRAAKQAIQHLVLVHETLGPDWLTPDRYRIGASSLLNDCLMQLRKEKTGTYQSPDYFTVD